MVELYLHSPIRFHGVTINYIQQKLYVILRIIKSTRMRWMGHVAQMGKRRTRIGCWWECQKERDH
jgi:hypothetical protein